MIVGIGVDLVQIGRMERLLERWGERLEGRLFTPAERDYAALQREPARHLAARFAAKEAALKALGTGMGYGLGWKEMEVVRDNRGQPALRITGRVANLLAERGVRRIFLSLTHEADLALAQVILEA